MLKCTRKMPGGKGNEGMFIERDHKICAAGLPTAQPTETVKKNMYHYLLKDEVDALIHDAIISPTRYYQKPPNRLDKRNAGIFTDSRDLINPPIKTKFQSLVDELKSTEYNSYWQKPVGAVRDPVPMIPEGFDVLKTLGKPPETSVTAYDVLMPKALPVVDVSPRRRLAYQIDRNYCRPAFNPDHTFGAKHMPDKTGKQVKCCLTDDRVVVGNDMHAQISSLEADYKNSNTARIGLSKTPNNNISCVPPGYTFGILQPPDNLSQSLTTCEINKGRHFFLQCLAHLNTLRKGLSKKVDASFFHRFYLCLKYFDKTHSGWLPKDVVYDFCGRKFLRFNTSLIEPLLETWNAFDGRQIEYATFVRVINYREPAPTLPKVQDFLEQCIDYTTTYREMVKPGQEMDKSLRAGLPTGRYLDKDFPVIPTGYCRADTAYLPHESDAKSCLSPNTFALLGLSHRDMYAQRSKEIVRNVFESAGETFTDEKFNKLWDEAKKYHSKGWVSFETFRKVLLQDEDQNKQKK